MSSTSGAEPSGQQSLDQRKPDCWSSAAPAPPRNGKPSFEDVAKFFSIPIAEAASVLGVSDSVLKRICRQNGVLRWPYRKVLAGKTVEDIKKDAASEKTKELDELPNLAKDKVDFSKFVTFTSALSPTNSGNHCEKSAPALVQDTYKLQQGVSMAGQALQVQANKFMQYGLSALPQPIQPKNISTFMDEFQYGFPSKGLSSVSVKWWGDSRGEGTKDTDKIHVIDDESNRDPKDISVVDEPSASLCSLRKRSVENGREALEVGISEGWSSYGLTKKQRLLLSKVFKSSPRDHLTDNFANH
ncbi:Protein RKD2 [Apostasia shenzhenica]|uniref:Protein RKD2 n=1 Tax=Apostasia shenzhenica TaxID=1088818 RepID=A0A2I0B3W7_9ASPA|nr:Protein RKD2 [Apostasia shenzhenica]